MRRRNDAGALSTELAVVTPVVIGLVLFVVYAGRTVEAEADVAYAAYEAARAATLSGTPGQAETAAAETAAANIAEGSVSCHTLDVAVDTGSFQPGGQVTVTITCITALSDLALLAVPGSRSFTATASSVVDTYRAAP